MGIRGTGGLRGAPRRARFLVVAGIFVLSWILYIDRAAISSAKGAIASELGLSDQAMGMVFSAFVLGYALMQIPTGRLADRWGPRIALATMVALVEPVHVSDGDGLALWACFSSSGSCSAWRRPARSPGRPAPSTTGCRRVSVASPTGFCSRAP